MIHEALLVYRKDATKNQTNLWCKKMSIREKTSPCFTKKSPTGTKKKHSNNNIQTTKNDFTTHHHPPPAVDLRDTTPNLWERQGLNLRGTTQAKPSQPSPQSEGPGRRSDTKCHPFFGGWFFWWMCWWFLVVETWCFLGALFGVMILFFFRDGFLGI